MKNSLKMISGMVLSVLFFACADQTEIAKDDLQFVEVAIPDAYKASAQDRIASEDDLIIDIQVETTDGKTIVGKVHLIMVGDQSLAYFALTENILLETGLTADYWIEALEALEEVAGSSRVMAPQGCFSTCNGIAKGEGRGWCKAECWLMIAIAVAGVVVAAV